jgi:hypothetical protein
VSGVGLASLKLGVHARKMRQITGTNGTRERNPKKDQPIEEKEWKKATVHAVGLEAARGNRKSGREPVSVE